MSRIRQRTLVFLLFGLVPSVLGACGTRQDSPLAPASSSSLKASDPEQVTIQGAEAVVEALLEWSTRSRFHTLPSSVREPTVWGERMIDFLPGGHFIANSFTGEYTEPRDEDTGEPGSIWFGAPGDTTGKVWSVQVKAYGREGLIWSQWVEAKEYTKENLGTYVNGEITKIAVEDWARRNGGLYPRSLYDQNQDGRNVFDLLPDGHLLTNAFTHQATEPLDIEGVSPGQIGYYGWVASSDSTSGYLINAMGREDRIGLWEPSQQVPRRHFPAKGLIQLAMEPELTTLHNALAARAAIEQWAQESGGLYPSNLNSTNALGHTVIDLLPGGARLRNTYTGSISEPRDGTPAGSGQIGYQGYSGTPSNSAFRIEVYGDDGVFWSYDTRLTIAPRE